MRQDKKQTKEKQFQFDVTKEFALLGNVMCSVLTTLEFDNNNGDDNDDSEHLYMTRVG